MSSLYRPLPSAVGGQINGGRVNFQEAQARFQWLEGQRAAGRMNDQVYRGELNQLRVVDAWGRQWMMQERTGQ